MQRAELAVSLAQVPDQRRQVVQHGMADGVRYQLQHVVVLLDLQQKARFGCQHQTADGVLKQFVDPLGDGAGAVTAEAADPQV